MQYLIGLVVLAGLVLAITSKCDNILDDQREAGGDSARTEIYQQSAQQKKEMNQEATKVEERAYKKAGSGNCGMDCFDDIGGR